MNSSKVIALVGPTATGKTDSALQIAKRLNGEIISFDSRQVYTGLDIGTGKMPGSDVEVQKNEGFWIIDGVVVHMYDVVDPSERFSVSEYVSQASLVLEDILKRGKLPILVGGTGLYLKGLLEGFDYLEIPSNESLRQELENLSVEELQEKLKALSPQTFLDLNNSDKLNKRRLVRRIEVVSTNQNGTKVQGRESKVKEYDVLKIGLMAPREILNDRIDARVDKRIEQGMVSEALELRKSGLSLQRMNELGLEYRYLADVLIGKLSKEEFRKLLKVKIHQYAKRQMTWFQAEQGINWLDITDDQFNSKLEKMISDWYNSQDAPQS